MKQVLKKREDIDQRFLETFLILARKIQDKEKEEKRDSIREDETLKTSEKTKRLKELEKGYEKREFLGKNATQIFECLNKIQQYKNQAVSLKNLQELMQEVSASTSRKILQSKLVEIDNKKFKAVEQARKKAENLSWIKSGYHVIKTDDGYELNDYSSELSQDDNQAVIIATDKETVESLFMDAIRNTVNKNVQNERGEDVEITDQERAQDLIKSEMQELESAEKNLKRVIPESIREKMMKDNLKGYNKYIQIRNKRLSVINVIRADYSEIAEIRLMKEKIATARTEIINTELLDQKSKDKIIAELDKKMSNLLKQEMKINKKISKQKEKSGLTQTIARQQSYSTISDLEEKVSEPSQKTKYDDEISKLQQELAIAQSELNTEHKVGKVTGGEPIHIYMGGDAYTEKDEKTGEDILTPRGNTNAAGIERANAKVNKLSRMIKDKEREKQEQEDIRTQRQADLNSSWKEEIVSTVQYDQRISKPFYLRFFSDSGTMQLKNQQTRVVEDTNDLRKRLAEESKGYTMPTSPKSDKERGVKETIEGFEIGDK